MAASARTAMLVFYTVIPSMFKVIIAGSYIFFT